MRFIKPVCATCGSDDVKVDAYAVWDHVTQEWLLATTFDKGAVCEVCGGETRLKDVPLIGDELVQARAYYHAIDNGWLPHDSDTAVEYCDMGGIDLTEPVEGEEM